MTQCQSTSALLGALAVACVLLLYRLDAIPGLHGDEAWAGLRAYAIVHGTRPTLGMNTYTGPLYEFLLAPILWWFGSTVFALRLLTAVAALATVALYHWATARWFDPTTAAYATLTLVTAPFFTAFGRIAGENFALNPLLATAAMAMLADVGRVGPRASAIRAVGAGVCLGLGIWNHAIFAALPIALAVSVVYRLRAGVFHSRDVWLVCAGGAAALVPDLIIQTGISSSERGTLPDFAVAGYLTNLQHRAADWPLLFARLAHGDLLFRRFAGELTVASPNVIAVLAAAGLVALWVRRARWPNATAALIFAVALFVTTLFICPMNSERYFLLMLYLVPVFVAVCFVWLASAATSRRAAGAVQLAFLVFLSGQLGRVGVNYFGAQARTRGPATLWLGREAETSAHYSGSDGLYRQLVSLGAADVVGEFFIVEPLRFYDLDRGRLSSLTIAAKKEVATGPAGSYAVFYSGGTPNTAPAPTEGYETVFRDAQFIVMRRVAGNEPHRDPVQ